MTSKMLPRKAEERHILQNMAHAVISAGTRTSNIQTQATCSYLYFMLDGSDIKVMLCNELD
jgi:hypothetical protein